MRPLVRVVVLAVTAAAVLFAPSHAAARMPPSCTDLKEELKFGFKLLVHGFPHHPVDIVEGKVTVVVGPVIGGNPADACAPQSFHVRLSLQYHHLGAWKPIASAKIDEANPVAGTTITASATRTCEEAFNGFRHWRIMWHYWGRTGLGAFQRVPAAFYPNRDPGRGMKCLSA